MELFGPALRSSASLGPSGFVLLLERVVGRLGERSALGVKGEDSFKIED